MLAYHGRFTGNHCHKYLKDESYNSLSDSVVFNVADLVPDDRDVLARVQYISSTFKASNLLF